MPKPALPQNAGRVNWAGPDDENCAAGGLIHCVRLPEEAGPANPVPVVVMAHGWGGDEAAMWIFARLIPPGVAVITPRAPVNLPGGGAVWFENDGSPAQPAFESLAQGIAALKRFILCLPARYPVDPARLVLIGFSQGAMTGNALAITEPGLARGVASLAGAIPPLPEDAPIASLPGLPVFIAHGLRDEAVPIGAARQTRDLFRQLGAAVTYGEYSVGHKMNTRAMNDLQRWLAALMGA